MTRPGKPKNAARPPSSCASGPRDDYIRSTPAEDGEGYDPPISLSVAPAVRP